MKTNLLPDEFDKRLNLYIIIMWIAVLLSRPLGMSSAFFWFINLVCFIVLFLRYMRYIDKLTGVLCTFSIVTSLLTFLINLDYLSSSLKSIGTNVGILTLPMFLCLFYSLKNENINEKNIIKTFYCLSVLGSISLISTFAIDFNNIMLVTLGKHSSYGISLSGLFYSKNIYGAFLALSMCADLYLYKSGTRNRIKGVLICIVKFVGIIMSFSRAALIQSLIVIFLFFWFERRRSYKEWIVVIMIAIFAGAYISTHPDFIEIIEQRIFRLGVGDAGREVARKMAIAKIPQKSMSILFGIGYAGIDTLDLDIDNSFYNVYFSGGIVKTILYVGLIFESFVSSIRLKKTNLYLGNICLAVGISYVVYSYFESVPLFELGITNFCFMLFMYIVPIGMYITRIHERQKDED